MNSQALSVNSGRTYRRLLLGLVMLTGLVSAIDALARPLPFLQSEDATYQLKNDSLVTFLQRFL